MPCGCISHLGRCISWDEWDSITTEDVAGEDISVFEYPVKVNIAIATIQINADGFVFIVPD